VPFPMLCRLRCYVTKRGFRLRVKLQSAPRRPEKPKGAAKKAAVRARTQDDEKGVVRWFHLIGMPGAVRACALSFSSCTSPVDCFQVTP
jgi:hypothetical protein